MTEQFRAKLTGICRHSSQERKAEHKYVINELFSKTLCRTYAGISQISNNYTLTPLSIEPIVPSLTHGQLWAPNFK